MDKQYETGGFGGTGVDFTAAFFALSYPQNKEYVTGYIYELWYFRYIGVAAAREWKE